MTAFWILVGAAALAALADWTAVARSDRKVEYLAKPAVLAALTAAAAVLPATHTDLVDRRWWFVAALACCLVGDVVLMLPRDLFVPGLAAFLVGHLLFIVGFLQPPVPAGTPPFAFSAEGLLVSAALLLVADAVPTTVILRSISASGQRALVLPVCAYVLAISTMVVLATNVGIVLAAVGSICFLASDTLLAFDRFTHPLPRGPLAVHVTYHLAQVLLVLSLLR